MVGHIAEIVGLLPQTKIKPLIKWKSVDRYVIDILIYYMNCT